MAKTLVVNSTEGTRVPFLRGILTRSLHDAGIEFDDAYKLASRVRQEISELDEISTQALRTKVLALLEESYSERIIEAYRLSGRLPATVMVQDYEGSTSAFSHSQYMRCLESCGLSSEDAKTITEEIYQQLIESETHELSSSQLGHFTHARLQQSYGNKLANRYLAWVDFTHSGRPLILLIGGTTGCGKSTIATEVAHRLGIVRTQSTDMLREVMRMMIPERLLPVLHTSAFNAWETLVGQTSGQMDDETLIADGYRNQMELLSVPCEAVVQRALREKVSLILEGVHVHPSLLERIEHTEDAVIVPIMLTVLKQNKLKRRLQGRGEVAPSRGSKRYLSRFEQIWSLQSYLLSEADQSRFTLIPNDDMEKATLQVMGTIIDTLMESFSATPDEVFRSES